jgi:hypothetical protein
MKNVEFKKNDWMQSVSLTLFNKVNFYAGTSDHWAISIEYHYWDRSLTFQFLKFYTGFEVWYEEEKD